MLWFMDFIKRGHGLVRDDHHDYFVCFSLIDICKTVMTIALLKIKIQ